jgi:HEAT repeat protein
LPLLDDAAVDVRRGAGHQLLARFNPADEAQVAAINNLLADSDPTIRGFALAAVRQMRPADQAAAAAAVAELLAAEREARADNRAAAARFLASLRADAATLLPQLAAAATTDPDAIVRAAALAAVAQVAPTDRKLPVLLKGLADAEGSVRLVAAARLRALGAEAKSAAGPLAEALGDSDARVRDAAAAALLQLGDEAVPVLGEQLASPRLEACKYALACLAKLGPAARPARAAVEKCRQDADAEVRKLAELALAAMGGP